MTTYIVTAVPWEHGWELHVEGVGVTQVRVLEKAGQQVRDLIETMTDEPVSDNATITIRPDLGDDLDHEIENVRAFVERAQRESQKAAEASRHLTRELRSRGLSVSDIATLMQISRGRVSQLAAEPGQKAS